MTNTALKIMINALSIVAAVKLVEGITFAGEWWKMIIIAAVFGLVNAIIKPIFTFFTFPLIIFSLGLFTFVLNAIMFGLTAYLSDTFHLGLEINGFWPAFWGALIISISSTVLSCVMGMNKMHIHYQKHTDKGE